MACNGSLTIDEEALRTPGRAAFWEQNTLKLQLYAPARGQRRRPSDFLDTHS